MTRKKPVFDDVAYRHLLRTLVAEDKPARLEKLLAEILTPRERCDLALRWKLLQRLMEGVSHRQIAKELSISPCKITRGSRILKDPNSVCKTVLANTKKRGK